ncbi:MAG: sugar ABC transporter permease [Clostridia bacterium]|nr:sugar ABC transporter permease [Clostridia bacterium]
MGKNTSPQRRTRQQPVLLRFFAALSRFLAGAWHAFRDGDASVKLSALIWGASCFRRRQFFKGVLLCLEQLVFIALIVILSPDLIKLGSLGEVQAQRVYDPVTRRNVWNDYDNSFLILLFGVICLFLLALMIIQWLRNLRHARQTELMARKGRHIPTFAEDAANYFGRKFHRTLLTLPTLGVVCFTIIPLLVMIAIAFTNYDRNHLVPTNLFTWVGLTNFRSLVSMTSSSSFAYAFRNVLAWTLIWAVLASLSCYIIGILMAMLISHRDTRGKRFWRTCFTVAMAVPQFVSLLLVRNLFADVGIVNTLCKSCGITDWLHNIGAIPTANVIPFLTHPAWAKPMILLINIWVGVPYQMLIATGILMNIPGELLEAARIDGANAWQSFRNITMPYILFITGPSLVNSIVSNINNFNVIWLLSRDVYTTSDQLMAAAGATEVDLLVTWLYRLTQDQSNYKMASVIGILVFIVCAALTLTAFSRLTRGDREGAFQ